MNLYQQQILDLYKNPHNVGAIDQATCKHRAFNPLCGDDITMYAVLSNDVNECSAVDEASLNIGDIVNPKIQIPNTKHIIVEVKWEGNGCAISMAAASLVTDAMKGKTVEEVMAIDKETLLEWMGIEIGPVRLKCALLPLEGAHEVVSKRK